MKYTLLQMTQSILSSMDSDQVNSIDDTAESQQVADIIKTTYYDLLPSLNLPEHYELFELTATTSATPVVMTLPSNVVSLEWLKYRTNSTNPRDVRQLDYWPLKDFLDAMYSLTTGATDVDNFSITTNGSDTTPIFCINNLPPSRYTTFNDNTIIFDSYDSAQDAFLQKDKTIGYGLTTPTWSATDNFTPDLDPRQFTLLLNEAKGQAFIELKQTVNAKAEKRARRGWINSQKTKEAVSGTYQGKMTNSYNFGKEVMFDEFHDPNKDDPRVKVIELDNNKMIMKRTDPYGFITVNFERGQVPESLKGSYTTWEAARAAVDNYLAEKGREEAKPTESTVQKKKVA